MSRVQSFIQHALTELDISVVGIVGWTGIHIDQYAPSRSLIRRATKRLKALEDLLRRVILFMALQIEGEPEAANVSPPPRRAPEPLDLAEGVVLAEFPTAWSRRLVMLPPVLDCSDMPDFSQFARKEMPHTLVAGRFSRRIEAL
ncbi:MAG: hypothetical protein AAF292_12390 [Pseudomonadota bacterium]